jgi:hypothetical protein
MIQEKDGTQREFAIKRPLLRCAVISPRIWQSNINNAATTIKAAAIIMEIPSDWFMLFQVEQCVVSI